MKGCKNCGCRKFTVGGFIPAIGYVTVGEGIENYTVNFDELDFEPSEDVEYYCTNCDTTHTYDELEEMEYEIEEDEDEEA